MKVSHSRLRCFSECPWRYRKLYVEGYKGEPIPAFESGKTLHRMVHEYGEWCYSRKVGEDEAQAKVIASTSDDAQVQKQFLYWVGQHNWEFEGLLGREGALFEQWHEYDLGSDDLFRCRIDMLQLDRETGELHLTDFKSGGWSYPKEPEECPIQLKLYALVMARELGEQVQSVHARIEYLGSGVVWGYDLTDRDFDETEEWLRAQVAKLKAETAFIVEPGSYCANCTCRAACTYGYSCDIDALLTEQIIQELDVLNAKREAYAEALKQRVADEGEYTDRTGRTWGYHEGEACWSVPDPVKYAEARRDAKLKPWAFCSWSQSALRRDAKRDPLRELLEEKPPERKWGVQFLNEDTNGAATPTRKEERE